MALGLLLNLRSKIFSYLNFYPLYYNIIIVKIKRPSLNAGLILISFLIANDNPYIPSYSRIVSWDSTCFTVSITTATTIKRLVPPIASDCTPVK